jgi:hypothetical protein
MPTCPHCQQPRAYEDFSVVRNRGGEPYLKAICKTCDAAKKRTYNHARRNDRQRFLASLAGEMQAAILAQLERYGVHEIPLGCKKCPLLRACRRLAPEQERPCELPTWKTAVIVRLAEIRAASAAGAARSDAK